eukprot:18985-Heterococcus_DN1.PRE.3
MQLTSVEVNNVIALRSATTMSHKVALKARALISYAYTDECQYNPMLQSQYRIRHRVAMCEHALRTSPATTTSSDTNSKQLRSEQYIVSAVAMARAYKTKQQQQQQQQK